MLIPEDGADRDFVHIAYSAPEFPVHEFRLICALDEFEFKLAFLSFVHLYRTIYTEACARAGG